MKITYGLLVIASLLTVFSCNDQAHKSGKTETTVTSDSVSPSSPTGENSMSGIEGCYMQVLARDTFAASLQQDGTNITGKLSFDNFEKDGSTGSVKGEREDNIIKLLYSFASEGTNSVMEIYFK